MKYPKIQTLFNRDEKFKVVEGDYRLPEFENIKKWYVTEKIDGTNVRVRLFPKLSKGEWIGGYHVHFSGRTDKAQLHPNLMKHLEDTFTSEKLDPVFPEFSTNITLFGEGYGPKIQKGENYRKNISFRLFDVYIVDGHNLLGGWWLEPENVLEIATKLGISIVPLLGLFSTDYAVKYVKTRFSSDVAREEDGTPDYLMEGIVARTKPLMFTRRGERIIWKLKVKDFPKEATT